MVDFLISLILSVFFILTLCGKFDYELFFLSLIAGIISHLFVKIKDWKRMISICLSLILRIPKAIFESFVVLFCKTDEIIQLEDTNDTLKDILKITLTPKSIAILTDGEKIHSHVLIRRKREDEG